MPKLLSPWGIVPRLTAPTLLVAGAALNAAAAVIMIRKSVLLAVLVAVAPLLAWLVRALVRSGGGALVFVAFAIPMSFHSLNVPHSGVWPSDIVVLAAIGTAIARRLLASPTPGSQLTYWPRLPATGLLLVLFAGPMLVGAYRGHAYYGTQLVGEPARLVLYAGIACSASALTPRAAYRGIVALFYTGTVWMTLTALYYIAAGGSQVAAAHSDTSALSTGGVRVLSGSVATYMAAALVLALLNLQLDQVARRKLLHVTIAALASFCVVVAYTRAVYVGLLIPLLVLFRQQRMRRAALAILPMCVPFLVIAMVLASRFVPSLGPTFVTRIASSPTKDANVQIRERSSAVVTQQFTSAPIYGVGFGRASWVPTDWTDPTTGLQFSQRLRIGQDPHDSYIYLLAGGGLLALVPFLFIVGAYLVDVRRRLRDTYDKYERILLLWSCLSLLVFLATALSGPVFEGASDVLAMWTLLVLPAVVARNRTNQQPAT